MIILHAFWEMNSGLIVWGESSTISPNYKSLESAKKPRCHPFALPRDQLHGAVSSLAADLLPNDRAHRKVTLFLPSSDNLPVVSNDVISDAPSNIAQSSNVIELKAWRIDAIYIAPDIALEFLSSLPTHEPNGIIFGDSLRFWIEAAKFALELISRQSFLPTDIQKTAENNETFKTYWKPFIDAKDSKRIASLTEVIPRCCLSLKREDNQEASASENIQNFLDTTIDAFIRRYLSPELIERTHQKTRYNPTSLWFESLFAKYNQQYALPKNNLRRLEFEWNMNAVTQWLSSISPTYSGKSLHTCFRLEQPTEATSDWRLSFNLQANDDPSLVIPAETVWQVKSNVITFLKRRFENPQERLLADLGKASKFFPPLEQSLKTACPTEVSLNTEDAYLFLRETAPIFEESGFSVLVPAWWQKPANRLGVKLNLKPRHSSKKIGSGLMGFDTIVNYQWQIAIGDTVLSKAEFEKLAIMKVPLVRIRGQWVEFKPEEIEKALKFFRKQDSFGEIKLGEALRLRLGQDNAETGLPVTGLDSEGWIKDLLDALPDDCAKMPIVESPKEFKGQLRPYQIKGISWLAFLRKFRLGACLADDMGLGKTIEFIAFLLYLQEHNLLNGPSLLVCPMSVINNWKIEAQRFAPNFKVMVHHGVDRSSADKFAEEAKAHDIVITSYSLVYRDEEAFTKVMWECVGLDEAQNIKNSSTKQSQAVRKLKCNYKVALTGTPVENRLSELWSIMDFLNSGYLGSANDFHQRFVQPIEKFRSPEETERLKRLIQPFVLRRVKTDPTVISDLPEKIESKVFCNLSSEQATLYEAVVRDLLEKIENSEGIERKGLVLATILRLKQVCNHPAQHLQDKSVLPQRSGKLIRLGEMLQEVLDDGDKALVFTQFAEMGKLITQYLRDTFTCEVLFLYGQTPKKQRDVMIQKFQSEKQGPAIFVLSLKAGGLGLNLTAANHVFHYDRWWNPAVENQATDRVFRIGQRKNVQVHKFVCLGTLEERIDQMIEQKKELAQSIVGTGEAWLTEMSNEQLREVFELNRAMVVN